MKKIPTSPHPPNPQTNNPNTMTTLRTDTDHWPHQLQNSVPRDNNKHRDLLVMNPYLDKVALWAVVSIGCRNGELADGDCTWGTPRWKYS